jgi:4a-hydroxytetrahydrobiopterin dehydratase
MGRAMSNHEISDAVSGLGWRYVLDMLCAWVPARSLADAAGIAARAVAAAGAEADELLTVDVRRDRVLLGVRAPPEAAAPGVALAQRLATALAGTGAAGTGLGGALDAPRSVQVLELAIDAVDIPTVRPFWKAVLGYADRPGEPALTGSIGDPLGQGPSVWFQQMDAPRPQRNRVHLDIMVPHDVARTRVEAALAAGGTLVSDQAAPAFWVLADAEGNEACISTWQGRD